MSLSRFIVYTLRHVEARQIAAANMAPSLLNRHICRHARSITLITLLLLAGSARADLQDEIQVYDDAINVQGEFGVELHVNTTPSGRRTPDRPGEVTQVGSM